MRNKALHNVEAANGKRVPLAMMDCDGFVPIQRRKSQLALTGSSHICSNICTHAKREAEITATRRPMPMARRLADFVKATNTFEALAEDDV